MSEINPRSDRVSIQTALRAAIAESDEETEAIESMVVSLNTLTIGGRARVLLWLLMSTGEAPVLETLIAELFNEATKP